MDTTNTCTCGHTKNQHLYATCLLERCECGNYRSITTTVASLQARVSELEAQLKKSRDDHNRLWAAHKSESAHQQQRISELEADAARWQYVKRRAELHGCPRDGYHLRIRITQDAPGLYGPVEMIDAARAECAIGGETITQPDSATVRTF